MAFQEGVMCSLFHTQFLDRLVCYAAFSLLSVNFAHLHTQDIKCFFKYRSIKVRIHYWSRSSCYMQCSTAIADNMIYANVLLLQQIGALLNIYIYIKERPAARCLSKRQGISEMNNARDWDS